ncbi:GDP-mannose 4,6-dehydratase [bacterium]|nr:GDP-mannose 4,6-dehydratase [bacterium]
MRVFVTGAEGFVGGHLIDLLHARGDEIAGTTLSKELLGDHIPDAAKIVECDILDGPRLSEFISDFAPDAIVHLAAMSSVSIARTKPELTVQINVLGTLNLLEAAAKLPNKPRTLIVSTAEVYGAVAEGDCPIDENHPVRPQSIYAASKTNAETLASFYARAHGLPVVIVRSFNHTGPRQAPTFVCSSFAKQVAEIEAQRAEPVMRVGNLAARRDFLDVRDVVRAYLFAIENAEPGVVYNICSGNAASIREVLDTLLSLTNAVIDVQIDPAYLRPLDIPLLVGSHARFTAATRWQPTIPLTQTLNDLLDYWRG